MSDSIRKQCANKSVKPELPMNYFDFWLKKDFWSFYEAACLMNATDPRLHNKQKGKQKFSKTITSHARDQGYIGHNCAMGILKNADWTNYSFMPKNNKVKHEAVFELFKNKDLKIPPELTKAMEKIKPKVENIEPELSVSKEMAVTLQPLIKIINDFEKSDLYKEHGNEILKKQIKYWLNSLKPSQYEKGTSRFHWIATKFIVTHYKIIKPKK